jgi:multidrug efflux pump subunit AcrB
MWIVKVALTRPYTFLVLALLILIGSIVVIPRTPTDIFPDINIPVVSVAWTYTGLNPEEVEGRLTTRYEKALTTMVDNLQHIESTSYNGVAIVKVFLQPGASIDTANAQVTATSQYILSQLPPGVRPPEIINFSASSVPILQLGLSGKDLSEQQLNDIAQNFLRPQLVTVRGSSIPLPYGGKQRQIMVNMDQKLMQSKNIAPLDVVNAVNAQNIISPSGTEKIGEDEYDVRLNTAPRSVEELSNIPIKQVGNTTIYLRDIASVSDGFQVQTNIVRTNGRRGVLITILKAGNASTLDVVNGIRNVLPQVASTVPPQLRITPLSDQSFFVRAAVNSVIREAAIAAVLTGLMILLFLGSWRSTLIITITIPLSILASVITLSFLHETINIMTLSGLALAVGILVDDATVTIESIERHFETDAQLHDAILLGAAEIATPAFVSTLCICIVFMPMFFLSGVARYLFVPLAEAVIFAMIASYILSRTLVPTLAMYLLKKGEKLSSSRHILARLQIAFECWFDRLRDAYRSLLTRLLLHSKLFIPVFLGVCVCAFLLFPWLGQDFFPSTDSGEFILHVRGKTGLRIEETARLCDLIEDAIHSEIPAGEIDNILDNVGLPYSNMNTMHSTNGVIGTSDADILVTLKGNHHPTANYIRDLRKDLPQIFPSATFYFLPADIVTQILDFGAPAPMDIQIEGNDLETSHQIATKMLEEMRQVPGLTDLRIQQPFNYPIFNVDVDRTKAMQSGFTEANVSTSVRNSLSGSFQISPMYFLDWGNGVDYNLVAQTPQYHMDSIQGVLPASLRDLSVA